MCTCMCMRMYTHGPWACMCTCTCAKAEQTIAERPYRPKYKRPYPGRGAAQVKMEE